MILNDKQRKVVIVGVLLFVLMGLFPPWTYMYDWQSIHREKPAGYALIISPPGPEENGIPYGVRIDISRLIVQWLIIAAATSLGVFMNRTQEKE